MPFRPVGSPRPDGPLCLYTDHPSASPRAGLGSTSLATTAAGGVHSQQGYYPYGETRYTAGELPTDFHFTGQRNDATIGLYDYHARWYDPALGRFISADTIVPSPANPQYLNRYAYVWNNPLVYIDPSGHKTLRSLKDTIYASEAPALPPLKPLWKELEREGFGLGSTAAAPQPPVWPENALWDRDSGAVRHLVETCGWTECSAVVFNAYTPGIWDFQLADQYHAGTAYVYTEGPVSLGDALQAAKEGRPNPLPDEQMAEGLEEGRETYLAVSIHLMAVKNSFWFGKLFGEQFGWNVREVGRDANFEPRYLQALVASHPWQVEITYERLLDEFRRNPALFEFKVNVWKQAPGRR